MDMIFEPDVTLTDYLLTAECALFIYLLIIKIAELPATSGQRAIQHWFVVFFASVGLAAFLGGTRHGFFPELESFGNQALDVGSMVALGLSTLAAWSFGAKLLFSKGVTRVVIIFATIDLIAYLYCLLFISQSFLVAIVNYLPSAIFALIVFAIVGIRLREPAAWIGALGGLLMFIGAGVQQAEIDLHPVYFTFNSVYHVFQAVALYMIFYFAYWLVKIPEFAPVLSRGKQPEVRDSK
jgi:hypothetical protein